MFLFLVPATPHGLWPTVGFGLQHLSERGIPFGQCSFAYELTAQPMCHAQCAWPHAPSIWPMISRSPGSVHNTHRWFKHSLRMYLHNTRPSAIMPASAMPMWSSILNALLWYEESSDSERFNVARTTCVSLCIDKKLKSFIWGLDFYGNATQDPP